MSLNPSTNTCFENEPEKNSNAHVSGITMLSAGIFISTPISIPTAIDASEQQESSRNRIRFPTKLSQYFAPNTNTENSIITAFPITAEGSVPMSLPKNSFTLPTGDR